MTLDEYIKQNYSEEQLSGWHDAILDIVKKTWEDAQAKTELMINLKSGDYVKLNNKVFWVCRCDNQPLNYLRNPSCQWCNMLRPTQIESDK